MNGKGIPLDTVIAAANTHDSRYCGARWSGCTGSGSHLPPNITVHLDDHHDKQDQT